MFPKYIFGNDDGEDDTIEDFQFIKSKKIELDDLSHVTCTVFNLQTK